MLATIKSSHATQFGQVHMRQEHWSNVSKVGAANWGNKTKKEEFELDEKCWKGYEKKGMKTMFGKRYPNCVKKEKFNQLKKRKRCNHTDKGEKCPVHGMSPCDHLRGGNGGKPGPDKNYVK